MALWIARSPARDSYVITQDDYIGFIARAALKRAAPAIFAEPFMYRHFLFLGYGLNDWSLRAVLLATLRMREDRRGRGWDPMSWAIARSLPSSVVGYWARLGINMYELGIDEFVSALSVEDFKR